MTIIKHQTIYCPVFYYSAPGGRTFYRVQVSNPPHSGKDIAKIKGVPGDEESEGRWKQISGLANRNLIRLWMRVRLLTKSKPNNYMESFTVNKNESVRLQKKSGFGRLRSKKTSVPQRSIFTLAILNFYSLKRNSQPMHLVVS